MKQETNFEVLPCLLLEGQKKNKNFSEDSWSPDQDLNPRAHKNERGM
jgi:hypothetical protein